MSGCSIALPALRDELRVHFAQNGGHALRDVAESRAAHVDHIIMRAPRGEVNAEGREASRVVETRDSGYRLLKGIFNSSQIV